MKLYTNLRAGIFGLASLITLSAATAFAQINSTPSDTLDSRYGLFNQFDPRSSYGQGVFPEPFIVDDSDLEVNEARLDWVHTKGTAATADELTAELEKGFGLLTVEAELHYEHDVDSGNVAEGIGNVDLGARYPLYQYVSANSFIDSTFGVGPEVGIPVHSEVSKNTEFVPKVFNDLRLGQHFTVQSIAGYSTLFGGGEDGGLQTLEYGFDFGYSLSRDQLHIPHVQQLISLVELSGETTMNHGVSGQSSLTGLAGIRVNLDTVGRVQPRLGLGFLFPVNETAHQDTHWGIATSLVFEY